MTAWRDVERADPEFAQRVRALFDERRHKTIATLRADGSPRISGIEATFEDGELAFGSMPSARKGADLRRDPRFALHSATVDPVEGAPAQWPGEAKISGRAIGAGPTAEASEGDRFHADIAEVVHTHLDESATMLVVEWWTPTHGCSIDSHRPEGITAMPKVISTLFVSADGVAEIDPDWHFPYFDENMGRAVGEDYDAADVLLIGRVTYDSFAGAWPDREAAGGVDASFAKRLGDLRKVVASRHSPEFSWRNSEPIRGDLVDAVTALKADPSITGILIPGSISVVQQLLAAGLVDELRLLVHPVAARRGRRLFDDGDAPYHLKLTASEVFPTGVIRVIYSPTASPTEVGYDTAKEHAPDARE